MIEQIAQDLEGLAPQVDPLVVAPKLCIGRIESREGAESMWLRWASLFGGELIQLHRNYMEVEQNY
jgi:hypothetical protein